MGGFADYEKYDGLGLAELVRKREVKPEELLDEAITRTEKLNPKINAVVLKHYDEARARIARGLPDGPFRGVPFLLKDLHLLLDGTVTSFGSAAYKTNKADHNSTLTERYLAAGLVIYGKTNSPEFGLSVSTEPRLYGPTRNPWNLEHSAGGSSGGAASAVAAGLVPVANASDGGGSIRVPAAACGLFGMKPTRARTPMGPDRGEGWNGMSISHVVSRSVRDSAAMLDATHGPAAGDPYAAPAFTGSYLDETKKAPGKLRISFTTKRPDGTTCHKDVVAAIEATAKLLAGLGHHVEEAAPSIDTGEIAKHQATLIGANVAMTLRSRAAQLGRELTKDDVEIFTSIVAEAAKSRSSTDYAESVLFIHQLGRRMAAYHERHDVHLSPTLATPPIRLGVLNTMSTDLGAYMAASAEYLPNIGIYNMTGQPSMSVPLHWNADGLPLGMMFTGRFGEEDGLFRLAAQLETALPWRDRRPKL
ncbi:MAG: amidase family protein [Parvibaculum sp.]|uniref:amidase n=1 Tax=Parvibaculum sp. TaxID=2024848 RepID=UPI0028416D31|nr:amidase family protein [Parvibaculum sp.]MDR3497640.1 amidase family protein [Parvibaculum sp.]